MVVIGISRDLKATRTSATLMRPARRTRRTQPKRVQLTTAVTEQSDAFDSWIRSFPNSFANSILFQPSDKKEDLQKADRRPRKYPK